MYTCKLAVWKGREEGIAGASSYQPSSVWFSEMGTGQTILDQKAQHPPLASS